MVLKIRSPHQTRHIHQISSESVDNFLRYLVQKDRNSSTHNRGPLIVLTLLGQFFQWCPYWFCTQNKTGDSTPTGDCCPSIVKVLGLNAYTNASSRMVIVGYLIVHSIVLFLKNSLVCAWGGGGWGELYLLKFLVGSIDLLLQGTPQHQTVISILTMGLSITI